MKKSLLLILLMPFTTLYGQEIIVSKTDLSEVKLYQSGAYVTRSAKAQLLSGSNKIVFTGLSPFINPQSMSVKGKGDATIMNVSFRQNYLKDKVRPKDIIQLEELFDSLTHRHQQLLNKSAVLKEEESLLLSNKSIGGANTGVLADELELMMEYFSKKLAEIKEESLNNSEKEKKIREQLDKVKNELAERNANYKTPTGDIIVEVNARSKSSVSFEIGYLINSGVSWYSFYDVRVKDINSDVAIIYKAKVIQQTGENWEDAKLRLSTGNPHAGTVKPELYPWYLSFARPQPVYYKQRSAMDDDRQAKPSVQRVITEEGAAMTPPPVQVVESQLSNEYVIAMPYTIKSDGQEYQVDIQSYSLPATYEYISAPKLDADAFLTARMTGWDNLAVSPGSANIYFDDAYVGESYINPASTDDTLTVSLGRDKRIVVKREKLKEFTSSKLFGGNKERTFAYDITVRNTKNAAVNIIIEDQLPISQDKEIEVKAIELSGGSVNDETGKVTWRQSLQSNESKKFRFSFKVTHPKNKPVGGI